VPDGTSGSQAPGGAWPGPPNEDLVVATPERVSFSYETANVGSRFVALLIDSVMQLLLLAGVGAVSLLVNGITNSSTAAGLILLVGSFVVFGGYFMVSEAVWSGQTLGKRALRLRAVDARGGPLTVGQAIIRNLVRIVDFLPSYYLAGATAIFVTRRNQRLGDLAAGTLVVRERQAVRLGDLAGFDSGSGPLVRPHRGRRLEPRLRRFVIAYAGRRQQLPPWRRAQLAGQVEPALRTVLPDLVARSGALAALEQLADEEATS
jgi:uncharacterized RDD family membrane protein YckC